MDAFAVAANLLNPPDTTAHIWHTLDYEPTPRQADFHNATEFAVLYGGAAGGGKTKALLMEGVRRCAQIPGLRVGAFRRTYGELKESLLAELAQIGYAQALGAVWNGSEYELRFPNGSLLMFRYAENMQDASRRQGGQYQLLLFDERNLLPPEVCTFIESRLRSGRADIPVIGVRSGTNPGGVGHGATKAAYIDATDHGTRIATDARGRTVRFIPSRVEDNPHLNPEYMRDLDGLPEAMRKAFRDGSWDVFAGQVFTEWNRARHLVPDFDIPATWARWAGVDYGYAAPWAVEWFAVDPDGRAWVYRELYATKVGEREQAQRIHAAAGAEQVTYVADSAMWARTGDSKPVADVYLELGVPLTPADKAPGSRLTRKTRLHTYLSDADACQHHRAQGWDTCPRLHVLEHAAPNLVRTLPDLPYDPRAGHEEDVDTRAEDHAYDALTYALAQVGDPLVNGGFAFPPPPVDPTAAWSSTMTPPAGWQPDLTWQEVTPWAS